MPDGDISHEVTRVQIAALTDAIKELNRRLDNMPTNVLIETRFKNVEDDVAEIKLEAKETRNQARAARQWAISAMIAAAGIVVAAVSVLQGGGAG